METNHDALQKVTWMRKLVRNTRAANLWNVDPPAECQMFGQKKAHGKILYYVIDYVTWRKERNYFIAENFAS